MMSTSDNTSKPVFLLSTLAIPAGFLIWILIGSIMLVFFPDHSGGNIGGNASASECFLFFGICAGVILLGIILAAISSMRRERLLGHGIGFWLVCVVPAVIVIANIVYPIAHHIASP